MTYSFRRGLTGFWKWHVIKESGGIFASGESEFESTARTDLDKAIDLYLKLNKK